MPAAGGRAGEGQQGGLRGGSGAGGGEDARGLCPPATPGGGSTPATPRLKKPPDSLPPGCHPHTQPPSHAATRRPTHTPEQCTTMGAECAPQRRSSSHSASSAWGEAGTPWSGQAAYW